MSIIICIIILTFLYIYAQNSIDSLYFEPSKTRNIEEFNNTNPKYHCIKKEDHYALYRKGKNSKKVLIVAHGNAGSFLDKGYIIDKLSEYNGDIYLFEYPGFSGISGRANIKNCVNELLYWINELKNKYKKIDLFGESIGGGIVVETCHRHLLKCINKIYLQSTFTSMGDVIKDLNSGLYMLYNILLLDDLNTSKNLKNIYCKKFVIIHSPDDQLINYNQAITNYKILKKNGKKVKFIKGSGYHGDTFFELKKNNIKNVNN